MSNVNKVILVGYIGIDPVLRVAQNGRTVTNFTLATTRRWKDRQGNKKEKTEWHSIVAYNKLGEICGQYLKKGSHIYVEGEIDSHKYTDKNGVERLSFQIMISDMRMLSSKNKDGTQVIEESEEPQEVLPAPSVSEDVLDDDIPF